MSQENVEIVRSTPVWNPDVQTACVRDVVMPRRRAGTDSDHAPAPWRQGGASHGSRLSSRLECVREGFDRASGRLKAMRGTEHGLRRFPGGRQLEAALLTWRFGLLFPPGHYKPVGGWPSEKGWRPFLRLVGPGVSPAAGHSRDSQPPLDAVESGRER
jgi:hypothetical protein